MKAYKIDLSGFTGKVRELISEAVQKKAFQLGYRWNCGGTKVQLQGSAWLDFWADSTLSHCGHDAKCEGHVLITPADFLSLTTAEDEPDCGEFDQAFFEKAARYFKALSDIKEQA